MVRRVHITALAIQMNFQRWGMCTLWAITMHACDFNFSNNTSMEQDLYVYMYLVHPLIKELSSADIYAQSYASKFLYLLLIETNITVSLYVIASCANSIYMIMCGNTIWSMHHMHHWTLFYASYKNMAIMVTSVGSEPQIAIVIRCQGPEPFRAPFRKSYAKGSIFQNFHNCHIFEMESVGGFLLA